MCEAGKELEPLPYQHEHSYKQQYTDSHILCRYVSDSIFRLYHDISIVFITSKLFHHTSNWLNAILVQTHSKNIPSCFKLMPFQRMDLEIASFMQYCCWKRLWIDTYLWNSSHVYRRDWPTLNVHNYCIYLILTFIWDLVLMPTSYIEDIKIIIPYITCQTVDFLALRYYCIDMLMYNHHNRAKMYILYVWREI